MIGESCPDLTHSIDSVQRLYNRDSESLFTFSFHGIEAITKNVDFPGGKNTMHLIILHLKRSY